MPRDGSSTRDRILDAALDLVLKRGYAGMSLDNAIQRVGITKGAFFYHFKSKKDLAMALLRRFDEADKAVLQASRERAEKLSRDPLQQLLIFVGLFEEMFEGLSEPYPGCLFASYTNELQQFDAGTRELIRESFLTWRGYFRQQLDAVMQKYPPRIDVDAESLADSFSVVIEGAFVLSKSLDEPDVVARQLRQFRNYLELLFG
jgi:TetR/AcrR family transcriptional repressor of nem operon